MKRLAELTSILVAECGRQCDADVSGDLLSIAARVEAEGDSFLTITLPEFAKGLERSLDEGVCKPQHFPGFGWCKARGVPHFLQGFTRQIFNREGRVGVLADYDEVTPSIVIDCIRAVRQISLLHKRVWALANDERQELAKEGFLRAESEVVTVVSDHLFHKVARIVVADFLDLGPKGFQVEELLPKHGPGSTVERLTSNEKWTFPVWYQRLGQVFPPEVFAFPNLGCAWDPDPVPDYHTYTVGPSPREVVGIRDVAENEESPVRVVLVPKTMKTSRVIAIEPSCMQYMQQGVARYLMPRIERGKYTGGRVNFERQSINQRLCLESSRSRRLATVDMKEASDRVSLAHAEALFGWCPPVWEAILACRSKRAKLKGRRAVTLRKFASMGSALCFPVEAVVFFVAIVTARLHNHSLNPTARNIEKMSRDVYVYGDDLMFPSDEASSICTYLEQVGFRVNRGKSFWDGKFRESCGVDAYDGQDVTPVYCRYAPPDGTDPHAVASWVALANGLYDRGYWATCQAVRDHVEYNVLARELPTLSDDAVGLHWTSYSRLVGGWCRWSQELHRFEVETFVPEPVLDADYLDGYPALHKCLSNLESRKGDRLDELQIAYDWAHRPYSGAVAVSDDHLRESVRPWSLALKARWVPAN